MDHAFAPFQVWSYESRSHEPNARLFICRIDKQENGEFIYHIALDGVFLRAPEHPEGGISKIDHLPVSHKCLMASVKDKIEYMGNMPDIVEGYQTWHAGFEKGEAGVFDIPVKEILDVIQTSLAGLTDDTAAN